MKDIPEILAERRKRLLQVKKEKEKALVKAPEGYLRVCKHGDKFQYYHRTDPKDWNGKYIREEELQLARRLAQKDYDRKLLGAAAEELQAIEKYLHHYPKERAEEIYNHLHEGRKPLVVPIEETDEEYVQKWKAKVYFGKEFRENICFLLMKQKESR